MKTKHTDNPLFRLTLADIIRRLPGGEVDQAVVITPHKGHLIIDDCSPGYHVADAQGDLHTVESYGKAMSLIESWTAPDWIVRLEGQGAEYVPNVTLFVSKDEAEARAFLEALRATAERAGELLPDAFRPVHGAFWYGSRGSHFRWGVFLQKEEAKP